MDSTDNKKLIRHVFGELVSGNPRPLLEIMADDFRFVITGSTAWSRAYEGRQAVLDELFTPLMAAD